MFVTAMACDNSRLGKPLSIPPPSLIPESEPLGTRVLRKVAFEYICIYVEKTYPFWPKKLSGLVREAFEL